MKKYLILFSGTAFLMLFIMLMANYIKANVTETEVFKVVEDNVKNSVACSGRVDYAETENVIADSAVIAKDICVKVGDKVTKGDKLMTVTGAVAQASALPSNITQQFSSTNIEEIYKGVLNGSMPLPKQNVNYISDGTIKEIYAPTSGVVSSINLKPNGSLGEGAAVAVISNIDKLQVKLSINESQISGVKCGQDVEITGAGFKGKSYKGKVSSISTEAKQSANALMPASTVDVIVSVEDKKADIRPGFTAKCKIITSQSNNTLIVPYDAVMAEEDGREFVFVYKNGFANKRYITTGKEYGKGFEVKSGVKKGDNIITNANSVYDGMRVKIKRNSTVKNNA